MIVVIPGNLCEGSFGGAGESTAASFQPLLLNSIYGRGGVEGCDSFQEYSSTASYYDSQLRGVVLYNQEDKEIRYLYFEVEFFLGQPTGH